MNTIKSSQEISYIYKKGKRIHFPFLLIIYIPLDSNGCKNKQTGNICFIAGKKQGNAVWRNKAKRRLRSLYKDLGLGISRYKVIFMANKKIFDYSYKDILNRVKKAINKELSNGK